MLELSSSHEYPAHRTGASYRRRMPPLPADVLLRPRVEDRIRGVEPGRAMVIEAAPGYGATTAVVQSLSEINDVHWLSLDGSLTDEAAEALVTELLTAPEAGRGWFVVDGLTPDAHPSACHVLAQAADGLSARARMVVISRGRFRLPGSEVHDESLLEFSDDEAMDLIGPLVDSVDVDSVTRVIHEAQGWASALVAGAYRMRAGHQGDRLMSGVAGELLDPWLQALSEHRRQLLLRIGAVDEFCEPLAAELTAETRAAAELVEAHCYTRVCPAPEGHGGQWWRLHPMLLSVLRQRSGGDSASCHARAAGWFARVGDVQSAMDHYVAAGRYRDAVQLLEDHQGDLLSTGSAGNVSRWYSEIANEHDRIEALLRAAWGKLLAGDISGAEGPIARLRAAIDAALRADPGAQRGHAWLAEQALLDAYIAGSNGDPAAVVSSGKSAMNYLSLDQNPNVAQMAPLLIARGFIWGGDYQSATEATAACATVHFSNRVLGNLNYGGIRALLACLAGEINVAAQIVDDLWQWAQANGIDIEKVPMFAPELARAFVLLEQGSLDQARVAASALHDKTREWHHICDATWAQLIVAKALLYAGHTGAALEQLTAAAQLAGSRRTDTALLVPLGHAQAQAHMAAGDMLRAERLLLELPASQTRTLLLAQAGLVRTPVLARKAAETLSAEGPRGAAHRHLLLSAAHRKTSPGIADEHLRAAAAIARRSGLRMLLAPPEPGLRPEAQRLAEAGDSDVAWSLGPLGGFTSEPTALSRGDLQLLALIPTRARNQDIADALGISVNTVKTRLRRLYSNLGVTDRDQAIAVARRRGLIT